MAISESVKRTPITLTIVILALIFHTASDLQSWCILDFHNVSLRRVHRLLTCHWLHWSTEHLAWDLGMFVVLGTWCEWRTPSRYALTLLLAATLIPVCLICWQPQIGSYRGLSGLDTALFGLLLADLLIEKLTERDWIGTSIFLLFLVGLFGKIAFELTSQANIFVHDASFTPVPLAHIVGAIIGLMIGTIHSAMPPIQLMTSVRKQRSFT